MVLRQHVKTARGDDFAAIRGAVVRKDYQSAVPHRTMAP
jgi:hypothetical protein